MSTPTIRGLCAAQAISVDYLLACIRDGNSDQATLQRCADLANTARDLLAAEPAGEGAIPTLRTALERLLQQLAALRTDPYSALQLEHAEREGRAALAAEPVGEGPSEKELYDLADEFNGDPVPAMRAALDRWRRPAAPPAPEVQRDAVIAAVTEALGGAYDCLRVWEAWNIGTMGPDDFALVAEDIDRVAEIADAAIEAMRPAAPAAPEVPEAGEAGEWDAGFFSGVCVALETVKAHGTGVIWREIVRSVGVDNALNYAANVNPEDWDLAGFSEYAQLELGKGRPLPAPQAGEEQP